MTRVYLSGPMTGKPDNNYPAFRRAAQRLRESGYDVVSPAEHDEPADARTYEEWLRWALGLLLKCQAIALLPDWQNSRGASLEAKVAHELGMRPIYIMQE